MGTKKVFHFSGVIFISLSGLVLVVFPEPMTKHQETAFFLWTFFGVFFSITAMIKKGVAQKNIFRYY